MSSKNKKEDDKIVRESLKLTSAPIYSHPHIPYQFNGPMAPMTMNFPAGPFGVPQFPQPRFTNTGRGTNGPCFNCQQPGHIARNFPKGQRFLEEGVETEEVGEGGISKKDPLITRKDNYVLSLLEMYFHKLFISSHYASLVHQKAVIK